MAGLDRISVLVETETGLSALVETETGFRFLVFGALVETETGFRFLVFRALVESETGLSALVGGCGDVVSKALRAASAVSGKCQRRGPVSSRQPERMGCPSGW